MAQVLEAQLHKEAINLTDYTATTLKKAGEVVQLADGRAGVVATTLAAGVKGAAYFMGEFSMLKTADVCILEGQQLYWVKATGKVSFRGDFAVGVAMADAAAAATELVVALNVKVNPVISLDKGEWVHGQTLGGFEDEGGVIDLGNGKKLSFDAVAEAAMAAVYSKGTLALDQGPIFEAEVGIYDIGDDAAIDINVGIANDTHATDCDSITESVFFHLDGSALSILAESDDGTTEVAATDTLVDAVDDTKVFLQIDARDLADIQLYIEGVNVLPDSVFKLDAATGPILPIVHVEKAGTNDTKVDVRVESMHLRTARQV